MMLARRHTQCDDTLELPSSMSASMAASGRQGPRRHHQKSLADRRTNQRLPANGSLQGIHVCCDPSGFASTDEITVCKIS
jgi:hypothetical protein